MTSKYPPASSWPGSNGGVSFETPEQQLKEHLFYRYSVVNPRTKRYIWGKTDLQTLAEQKHLIADRIARKDLVLERTDGKVAIIAVTRVTSDEFLVYEAWVTSGGRFHSEWNLYKD